VLERLVRFVGEVGGEDTYDTAAGDGTLTLFDRSGSSDGGCCESEDGED
jgi:hypothetical protein